MHCEITALHSYPVKSCRGSAMQTAQLSDLGMAGDRQLMILRGGQFVNQKQLPQLATIVTTRISANEIEFSTSARPSYRHLIDPDGERLEIDLYGTKIDVVHQGPSLAQWMSDAVGEAVELVSHVTTSTRQLPVPQLAGLHGLEHTGFVDVSPLLLTNEASLEALNDRLPSPVGMDRFRPNIVVRGLEPWAEDTIQEYRFSNLTLFNKAQCERCAVTCTDQLTGERTSQPLRVLREFRKFDDAYSSGIVFGVYLSITGSGSLSVGDRLLWQNP